MPNNADINFGNWGAQYAFTRTLKTLSQPGTFYFYAGAPLGIGFPVVNVGGNVRYKRLLPSTAKRWKFGEVHLAANSQETVDFQYLLAANCDTPNLLQITFIPD